jgi:hypothetical protein
LRSSLFETFDSFVCWTKSAVSYQVSIGCSTVEVDLDTVVVVVVVEMPIVANTRRCFHEPDESCLASIGMVPVEARKRRRKFS